MIPLQEQIYAQIRAEIEDGLWEGRDDFPSEAGLAERFSVSVITSRRVLSRLGEEGWIERGRGRRTRVVFKPNAIPERGPSVYPVGLRLYRYSLNEQGVSIAPAEACAVFGVPAGSKLWVCRRTRRYEGSAHSVTMNVQRAEVGSLHSLADLRRLPMASILATAGKRIGRLTRQMSAIGAPEFVARPLGIELNSPVLVHTFTVFDVDDEPIEWVRIHVHPQAVPAREDFDLESGTWSADSLP